MSDKGSNIKSRLPSRHVSVGPKSAPHRSMYYAMGMTEEQIYQPFVGVERCWRARVQDKAGLDLSVLNSSVTG